MLHIIESKSYDVSDADRLKDAIVAAGNTYIDIDYIKLIQFINHEGLREKFMFWGSPTMASRIDAMYRSTEPDQDKFFRTNKNYTPSSHYAGNYRTFIEEMGAFALNNQEGGSFLGYWQLRNLLPVLGHRKYFVRPVSGNKLFHGGVYDLHEEWQRDKLLGIFGKISNDTEVFIAPAREILNEYRFFVSTGIGGPDDTPSKVITGSRYIHDGEICIDSEGVSDVQEWLTDILNDRSVPWFRPPTLQSLVIDVAETPSGDLQLLECNNYTTSAFYASDVSAIVKEIVSHYDN